MKVQFKDLDDLTNPMHGETLTNANEVRALLDQLHSRTPFMCELVGVNGYMLTVGIGGDRGCVQYSPSDGTPPYLMAVSPAEPEPNIEEMEFVVGGTATPIDARYCFAFELVKDIAADFVEQGEPSSVVRWEEF